MGMSNKTKNINKQKNDDNNASIINLIEDNNDDKDINLHKTSKNIADKKQQIPH